MTKEKPLWWNLYFSPLHTEFARIVGYAGIALDELRKLAEPLGEQYGKEKVQAAANEISKLEDGRINLTPEARKAAWQLLGPPPEHPAFAYFYPDGKPEDVKPEAPKEEPPKKRTRKKKVA